MIASAPESAVLEALLARCARQDARALEELYELVSPLLLSVLMRLLRTRDLAEDALQDVFVRVWRQAGQYQAQRGRAFAWLVSIARYRAIDMLRARKDWVSLDSVEEPEAQVARAESTLTLNALERCMQVLSGDQRQCLALAYQQGLSQDNIATAINRPLGTVKSWVRQALRSLRRCLES